MTEQQPVRRLPFNEEFTQLANGFTQQIIDTIPEIESVAVVVSYAVPQSDLPYAVMRGQNGPLRTPVEIVHMSMQLWRALNFQLQNGYQCIRTLDDYMKEKTDELKQLQDQINAANKRLQQGSSDQVTADPA